jgi:PHS family inorganic phosphate transporter-like MFS transporter
MLDYVYWGSSTDPKFETAINCATLAGCVLGMVSFGFLGDKFGRRKLYGIELLTLIVGTLGLVMSSPGYIPVDQLSGKSAFQIDWTKVGSMNVVAWLVFWRIVSGMNLTARVKRKQKALTTA